MGQRSRMAATGLALACAIAVDACGNDGGRAPSPGGMDASPDGPGGDGGRAAGGAAGKAGNAGASNGGASSGGGGPGGQGGAAASGGSAAGGAPAAKDAGPADGDASDGADGSDGAAPHGWSAPVMLSDGTGLSLGPRVTVDLAGVVTVAWHQYADSTGIGVHVNRFSTGWTGDQIVEQANDRDARYPQVAALPTGDVLLTYAQDPDKPQQLGDDRVTVRRYGVSTSTWSAATPLQTAGVGSNGNFRDLAANADGRALAAWLEHDTSSAPLRAMVSRLTGTTWSTASPIDDDTGPVSEVAVSAGTGDAAFVGWVVAGTTQPVKVARYASGAWQTPERVSADTNVFRGGVRIVSPAAGEALVVWRELVTPSPLVAGLAFATRTAGSWSAPAPVYDTGATDQASPELAIDSKGAIVVVWADRDGTGWDVVVSRRTGTTWGAPKVLTDTPSAVAPFPHIGAGPDGSLVVVWEQYADAANVRMWARRFDGATWSEGVPLEATAPGNTLGAVRDGDLVVDSSGRATAVWSHGSTVWASRFTP